MTRLPPAPDPGRESGAGADEGAGHLDDGQRRLYAQLAARAGPRHGIFGLDELVALGLSARAVQRWAATRRVHRVHRVVYSVVAPALLTVHGRYRAATLACGGARHAAALSHRSAADLHGLRSCHRRVVEVIVPGRSTHRHPGIQTHRSIHLDAGDVTIVDGIATTTVARTLLDLAAVAPRRGLERALDQAEILRTFDLAALLDQLQRNPRHPGAGRLHATLVRRSAGETVTDSALEETMHGLLAGARVPAPQHHGAIDPGDGGPILRPDFVWRAPRVVVEVDGAQTHLTRRAFEDDRERDQRLTAAGWRVVRITWRQLHEEPDRVVRLLVELLGPAGELGAGVGI